MVCTSSRHMIRTSDRIVRGSAAAAMKLNKLGHSRARDTDRLKRLYWGSCFRYRLLHRDWVSVPRPSDGGISREGSHVVERPVVIGAYLPAR